MRYPDPIAPGDVIKADDLNLNANNIRQNRNDLDSIFGPPSVGGLVGESAIKVRVYNNTGDEIDVYSVWGIKQQAFSDIDEQLQDRVLEIEEPDLATHIGKWVILGEKIPDKGIGIAFLIGTSLVKVQRNHADDIYCEIATGVNSSLKSGPFGSAKILWTKSAVVGTDWGIVQFPIDPPTILVKLLGDIDSGNTGNVQEYLADGSTPKGNSFSATNRGPDDAESGEFGRASPDRGGSPFFSAGLG